MDQHTRASILFKAQMADQAKRYDEVVELMKEVAKLDGGLSMRGRSLLISGYKNLVGARRDSLRTLSLLEEKMTKRDESKAKIRLEYRQRIEDELSKICNDFLSLLDKHLFPFLKGAESLVHYYKTKGDYYRYLAEFKGGPDGETAAEHALEEYETATTIAVSSLAPSHPTRLGLALNFSVFYAEILDSLERACIMTGDAFDEAHIGIDSFDGKHKDSKVVLGLLRDNFLLWITQLEERNRADSWRSGSVF